MKNLIVRLLFLNISLISNLAAAQTLSDKESVTGSWLGRISVSAISVRIVFNLSIIEKDSLVATMDSPDQGAKNIKLGPVTFDGKAIKISAGAMLAEYNGILKSDTLIEGTWKQAGKSFDLNLSRLKTAFIINRPQEPKPPFPYISEDVTFLNIKFNINLAGTLTIPEGDGPFPAVIMITGSGAQNRNEEIFGHKPFLVIADYLTRKGIAVLRYDDRGVGKSQGNPASATSADFATDAEAAFEYLKNNPKIKSKAIGLIGHSEGGLIAPLIASSNKEIACIVSLAGPGVSGEEIILRQGADISRASGIEEKKINENNITNKKIFAVLKKEKDNKKAEEKMMAVYKDILMKQDSSKEAVEKALKEVQPSLNANNLNWLRYFIITNPGDYWKKVKCPVLALNGEKDIQVAADENLPSIEKALRSGGNNSVKTIKMPGLNHLFQHCKTGLPGEYGEIEETFSPEVLKIISDWIRDLK
jgi:uncharacterized protein